MPLALLLAIHTAASCAGDTPVVPSDPSKFHLILLAGQSNMAGRGKVEPQDLEPNPRVLSLDKNGQWQLAVDPLHFDKPRVAGVGLGRSFAIAYANAHPGVTVGLIACAAGGSPIESWEPGAFHDQTHSNPYDDALIRTRLAQSSGTLKAILWHQGESDSSPTRSPLYESKLHGLIARMREDFRSPAVPFIVGQLGQFDERPWSEGRIRVDAVLRSLPSKVAHTGFVSSAGLKHGGDEVHFDAESLREFGRRYFSVYQEIEMK